VPGAGAWVEISAGGAGVTAQFILIKNSLCNFTERFFYFIKILNLLTYFPLKYAIVK
jgi:hypothetical protein